ncbi:hypothetical protein GS433_15485 [Rhodococcus hoagii]|uniref:hypothetical protein n=1 Tax=Rhodococcus hoagii TaxID=43767 RepID=UPI0007CD7563|nr:hypothetical protein [Prescottella equi]MBM4535793.1 hypothetical protein [Prescottella equi]NKR81609.1 hypothetical protein [Prescottella equi]
MTSAVIGWRINLVTPAGRIYGFDRAGHSRSAACHPAPDQHNLARGHHRSPHPRCECGWRIVTNPRQFPDFFDGRGCHWWRDRVAIQAEAFGPTLPGVDTGLTADPPDTIRAQRIRWIPGSPIILPGRLSYLATSIEANYPGRVTILPSRDWAAFPATVSTD